MEWVKRNPRIYDEGTREEIGEVYQSSAPGRGRGRPPISWDRKVEPKFLL